MPEPKQAPGSNGLPFIGETVPFIKDMFRFTRDRFAKHGPVFRSHILGVPSIFLHGAELTDQWLDDNLVKREGSLPKNVEAIFGGRSLPLLDGPEHRTRKRLVLSAFGREAFAAYLPKLEAAVRDSLARATAQAEFAWLPEMKSLVMDGMLRAMLSMAPGPELDDLVTDYGMVTRGFTGLPVNFPGTDFRSAILARERIFSRFEAAIDAHTAAPQDDGLSRLMAAEVEGEKMDRRAIVLEMHHIVLAGLIIFAQFAYIVQAFTQNPEVLAKLRSEVDQHLGSGALSLEKLLALPYLEQVMLESKRACPNVPVSFGRAKQDFELAGHLVKKDSQLFMGVYANNMDATYFPNPDAFDPDRFSQERAEHKRHRHAYQPQGPGPELGHRCAGLDFSSLFIKVFFVMLARDASWTLPEQDLGLRWDIMPPEPRDGLRAAVTKRRGV
jgi:retinoid hydroxylase